MKKLKGILYLVFTALICSGLLYIVVRLVA